MSQIYSTTAGENHLDEIEHTWSPQSWG